jgi:hypothetical protein
MAVLRTADTDQRLAPVMKAVYGLDQRKPYTRQVPSLVREEERHNLVWVRDTAGMSKTTPVGS